MLSGRVYTVYTAPGLVASIETCGCGKVLSTMTMLVPKGAVAQQPGNVFARKRT